MAGMMYGRLMLVHGPVMLVNVVYSDGARRAKTSDALVSVWVFVCVRAQNGNGKPPRSV